MSDHAPAHCPACGYDVTTTLRDGIEACPECGGLVDEATLGIDGVRRRWSLVYKRAALSIAGAVVLGPLTPLAVGVLGAIGLPPEAAAILALVGVGAGISVLAWRASQACWMAVDRTDRMSPRVVFALVWFASLLAAVGSWYLWFLLAG